MSTTNPYIIPTSKQRPVVDGGSYQGVCVQAIDMGTQSGEWQGKPKTDRKVRLVFELTTEANEDGTPFLLGRTFVASLHEKSTLRPVIKALVGEVPGGLDLQAVLGKPCVLTVSLEPKQSDPSVKTNRIESVAPLMKGIEPVPAKTPQLFYHVSMGKGGSFDQIPEFMKEDIAKSPEFKDAISAKPF